MDVEEGVGERFRVEVCSYNVGVGDVEVGMEREVFLYRSDAVAWVDGAAEPKEIRKMVRQLAASSSV